MALVRFAVPCALGALLCAGTSGMPRQQAGRPDNQSASPLVVPQAHVAPHTITLPVVEAKDIRFTRLSTDEGLSQTRVIQIVEDDQGFMWFGSQYGLNRYDGYKFKVFKHEPGNPNSLSGVLISSLFKDRSGLLWIGCDEFLDKFDPVKETFTHYRIDTDDAQGETVPVTHISQDHTGILWLATSMGLYKFDPSNGRTIRYHHDPNNLFSLSSSQVKATAEDKKGRFWVASSEGLDEFDRNTGKVTLHVPLHERGEMSLYEDRFGVFWITHVTGGGLAVFDRSTNTLIPYSFHKGHLSEAIPTGMMAILEDQDGNLWFGTMGDGLLKFDRKGRKFIRYRNDPMNPESLGQDDVAALFQDREGNIWVGLHMMAPNRFSTRPPFFEKFKHEPGNRNSLSGTMVNGIYEDREGILWIGAIDGLNRVDRRTGQYTFYRTGEPGISSRPTSIIEDRSGFLWLGSDGHGLTRFDPKTGRFKAFRHSTTERFSLSSDLVTRVLIDHTGTLWAATFDGLDRFDPATSHFTVYRLNQQIGEIDIEVKEDSHGALWVGTHSSGLERFDPTTKKFTAYRQDVDDPTSLSNNRVNSVYFDHSGTMWVGTQNGLDKFDPKTDRFKSYYEQDGLSGNVVSCILEDERGKLWMSTNNGLSVLDRSEQTFRHYSAADGLPGDDLTGWGACYKSPSGEMFFGGFSGGIAVHPNKVVDSLYVPRIVLTNFRLFDHPVTVAADSPLSKSIGYTNVLRLSHDQNVFSLEFSALSYFNPATNRYRYKLEGLDRQWHEVGSDQRLVTYTTLPARTYTFRAQGATSLGAWSEPGVELRLEILPAWWNTWWFRALVVAVSLAVLCGLYKWRVGQLRRQEKQLRDVINAVPANVWSTSPDGAVDFVNQRWQEITGLPAEEALGWNWEAVLHPDDRTEFDAAWRAAVENRKSMEHEIRVRGPDGEYRWLFVRNVPLRDKRGRIVKWYGTSVDIEDRKRAEERLHAAMAERFRLAAFREEIRVALAHEGNLGEVLQSCAAAILGHFDAAFARVWTINNDQQMLELQASAGMYTHLNGAHSRIALGQHKIGLIAQERKPYLSYDIQGDSRIEDKDWARREGMVSFAGYPLVVEDRVVGVMGLFSRKLLPENAAETLAFVADAIAQSIGRKHAEEERERLRQLEADLEHINRVSMMGELTASLAHELNQPITAAITNAKTCARWLSRNQPELEEAREAATRMVKDGIRAAEIINGLRSFYKKGAPAQREVVDVSEVIREMTVLLGDEAAQCSVSVSLGLAEGIPKVMADRVQLQQVFMNLMLNAIEAMQKSGGELTIKLQVDIDGNLLISVSDTGVGLPLDKVERIFDAFYTTKPQGTGMGLAITRRIIEAHGGRLSAMANPVQGATFQFTLPTQMAAHA